MWDIPWYLILLTADRFLQQTAANGDQIRDIEERVQSLCGVLAYPVGDQDGEEKARREVLRRFVSPPSESAGTPLNRVVHPQEVSWDYCKAQTVVRTKWDCEVLQER